MAARDLPPDLASRLQEISAKADYPRGSILFRRGDPAVGLMLLLSGKVKLGFESKDPVFPSRYVGPGALIGLPATMSGEPYSLTAEVVEDAVVAFVPREDVLNLLRDHPQHCLHVMQTLSEEVAALRTALRETHLRPKTKK